MAANVYGLQTLTFGNPALTGYVVQSYTTTSNSANVIEIADETGNRKCVRYDDDTTEITIDAYFAGATLPTPGSTFTYDSVTYECTSIEKKGENKNATKVTLKGKKSEFVSYA